MLQSLNLCKRCCTNTKSSSFHVKCLPQNCKEKAVPKMVKFVESLSGDTNAKGYLRSKQNSVIIQTKSIQIYPASQTKIVGLKQ